MPLASHGRRASTDTRTTDGRARGRGHRDQDGPEHDGFVVDFERTRASTVVIMTIVTDRGLTIEEASERTGVSAHTLRYYERIGLLAEVPRGPGGHRRYTDADLGAVVFLTLLRQTGMSIRDMQRFVDLTRQGDHTIPQRVEVLSDHRERLVEQLALLNRHLRALDHKIGIYRAMLADAQSAPTASPSGEKDDS